MKPDNRKRSVAATAGVLAMLAVSMLGVTTTAAAAPGDGGEGSIIVHKFEPPSEGNLGSNDGSEIDLDDLDEAPTPVPDVGFTVCEIDGIDLTDSEGWDILADLKITLDSNGDLVVNYSGSGPAPTVGDCVDEQDTGPDGSTTFSDLPADVAYVVYESNPPENVLSVSQPVIVTLPYPGNGSGDTWVDTVYIYPKNALLGSGSSKNGTVIGNQVVYDIKVPINNLGLDENNQQINYTQLEIDDALADALAYAHGAVTLDDPNGNPVGLTEGTHYAITPSGNNVNLEILDPAGLGLLNTNLGGTLTFTITANLVGTGATQNVATISINGDPVDVTDPETIDTFSAVFVYKTGLARGATDEAAATPLGGATFAIFSQDNNATIATCPGTYAAAVADPDLNAYNFGSTDFVSAAVTGATPEIVLAAGDYCVYETGVPAGYKGQIEGEKLTVVDANSQVTIMNRQVGSDPGDLPALPITGAAGQILLIVIAGSLVLIAGVLYLVRSRRQPDSTRNE